VPGWWTAAKGEQGRLYPHSCPHSPPTTADTTKPKALQPTSHCSTQGCFEMSRSPCHVLHCTGSTVQYCSVLQYRWQPPTRPHQLFQGVLLLPVAGSKPAQLLNTSPHIIQDTEIHWQRSSTSCCWHVMQTLLALLRQARHNAQHDADTQTAKHQRSATRDHSHVPTRW
jgi:hypothetical protein